MIEQLLYPLSLAEFFGVSALVLHLIAYGFYAHEVFHERIRPNVITWLMWLFGGVVELVTYNAIVGSHWSTNALPFACVLGIGGITIAIAIAQLRNRRNRTQYRYHRPVLSDYFLVLFDASAVLYWIFGGNAVIANALAVSTSIITFIPLWRTTYLDPDGEQNLPWIIWSIAYLCMFFAVYLGESSSEIGLYIFPLYYFFLHLVVAILTIRHTRN
jgi:hypothetical protein